MLTMIRSVVPLIGVATAATVDCDVNPSSIVPQGLHLAYAGDASTRVVVSFFTCGSSEDAPLVNLLNGAAGVQQECSTSQYYTRSHYDVVLSGLQPGTSYGYTVSLGSGEQSAPFTFNTAPVGGNSAFTAAFVGDMGVNNSAATIARLTERASSYEFTTHLGDIGYGDDYHVALRIEPSSGRSYEAVYDLFQQSVEPVAAAAPYMVMVGNHDVSCHILGDVGCPKQQHNFSAYRHRFRMPSAESGASPEAHHNMWHSWRAGSVHFVAVSTETDFPGSPTSPLTMVGGGAGGGFGDQLGWLRRDLSAAAADPSVTWIVAMGHRPWYASTGTDWPLLAPRHAKHAFEPLLHEFGVDIWMCGHKHYYERTVPAFKGKADPSGTVTIINGAAGNNEGVEKGRGIGGLTAAVGYKAEGFGELTQLNATALRWRYMLSADGSVIDELILHPRARPKNIAYV